MALHLEDFIAGQTFSSGSAIVEPEAIARFAMEFDPQPFHLDAAAAERPCSAGLPRADGKRPRSPCGSWSTAR